LGPNHHGVSTGGSSLPLMQQDLLAAYLLEDISTQRALESGEGVSTKGLNQAGGSSLPPIQQDPLDGLLANYYPNDINSFHTVHVGNISA